MAGKTLHQQKDYGLLYFNTDFIAVVWNHTHNIFEVYLYFISMSLSPDIVTDMHMIFKTHVSLP